MDAGKGTQAVNPIKLTVRLLIFALVFAVGHSLEPVAADKRPAPRAIDQRESVKVIEAVVNAWNHNDADTIAKHFLPEAVVVLPSGAVIQSRAQIRKRIIEERNGRLQDTRLHQTVESVSLRDNNRVVVKGEYQLAGMRILNLFEVSPQGTFVIEQVEEHGRWMIARAELHRHQQGQPSFD